VTRSHPGQSGPADRTGRPPRVSGTVDFSFMYAAHDAFSRDLARLAAAAAAGRAREPVVRLGWATFARQLAVHHTAEDTALWPVLRAKVTRAGEVAVLDAMEAEHAQVDPLLAQVERSLADGGQDLAGPLEQLTHLLAAHLRHEEDEALPLVETYLGAKGWAAFGRAVAKIQGLRGVAEFFPWMLEGADPATRDRLLALLPPPARLIHRTIWARRYARTPRWQAAGLTSTPPARAAERITPKG
jgi:Hemerythrin HHE cation binding domain